MILVISIVNDVSTNMVIDWLNYYNKKYLRINACDKVELRSITITDRETDFELLVNDVFLVKYSEIVSVWYRRGIINLDFKLFGRSVDVNIRRNVVFEYSHFQKTIYKLLLKKKFLSSYITAKVDKIDVLDNARRIELGVPSTYFIKTKSELRRLLRKYSGGLISKGIFNSIDVAYKEYQVRGLTQVINYSMLEVIPENFEISIVQERVMKKYEIRSFVFFDSVYSMAIFSQNNSKTAIDFRNYDDEYPNRTVPFKLPDAVEMKLIELNESLGLNTSSIDLVFGVDDKYYFLDLNPVGQFGMVSSPCNYNIEKLIAEYL